MSSSQRPYFLSSLFAALRPRLTSSLSASSQPNKHHTSHSHSHASHHQAGASSPSNSNPSGTRPLSTSAAGATPSSSSPHSSSSLPRAHAAVQIPVSPSSAAGGRRRGSDSSSEGFRDVRGAEKWYIGGRTAGGEERFFKLGVVRRVRSQDRLSLDRLSL
ncbi:hypothetical protein DL770_000232 [Monosporascus sp. CRB-9-2]|nr:hypothetical protein DL770_000232 [Monosporascus sp. CRB-9-2]